MFLLVDLSNLRSNVSWFMRLTTSPLKQRELLPFISSNNQFHEYSTVFVTILVEPVKTEENVLTPSPSHVMFFLSQTYKPKKHKQCFFIYEVELTLLLKTRWEIQINVWTLIVVFMCLYLMWVQDLVLQSSYLTYLIIKWRLWLILRLPSGFIQLWYNTTNVIITQ